MTRGKLRPVPVPWMVSRDVPDLRVSVIENRHAVVRVDVATLGEDAGPLVNMEVDIQFDHGQWVRTYPAASDANPVPQGHFDWSDVGSRDAIVEDVGEYLRQFRAAWVSNQNCPNPYFYEVSESRWLDEENARRFGCRHFVLVGHDMWLEVLCMGFTWTWVSPGVES